MSIIGLLIGSVLIFIIPVGALFIPIVGGFNDWEFWKTYVAGVFFALLMLVGYGYPLDSEDEKGDSKVKDPSEWLSERIYYALFVPAFAYLVGWSASAVWGFIKQVFLHFLSFF